MEAVKNVKTKHAEDVKEIVKQVKLLKEGKVNSGDSTPVARAAAGAASDPWHTWHGTAAAAAVTGDGGGGKGGGLHRGHEYYPRKKSEPNKLREKPEEWTNWKDSVLDYFDDANPGMQGLLSWIHEQSEPPELAEVVAKGQELNVAMVAEDQKKVWRALKQLTE